MFDRLWKCKKRDRSHNNLLSVVLRLNQYDILCPLNSTSQNNSYILSRWYIKSKMNLEQHTISTVFTVFKSATSTVSNFIPPFIIVPRIWNVTLGVQFGGTEYHTFVSYIFHMFSYLLKGERIKAGRHRTTPSEPPPQCRKGEC